MQVAVFSACVAALGGCGGSEAASGDAATSDAQPVDSDLGKSCSLLTTPPDGGAISTQALECSSRMCLQTGWSDRAVCTKVCHTDDDCSPSIAGACTSEKYICRTFATKGEAMCVKFCMCASGAPADAGVDCPS